MDFTASDVLLKAASRIEEEGMWCHGLWFDMTKAGADVERETGYTGNLRPLAEGLARIGVRVPECAQGAMASAVVELVGKFDAGLYGEADDLLYETLGVSVPAWNDTRRSAHEVAEAMRRAAS